MHNLQKCKACTKIYIKISRFRDKYTKKTKRVYKMTNNHELLGIHHVTAMTDDAERNYKFLQKY